MRYRFGEFELDPREGRLERAGLAVDAQPKVIDAIAWFAGRAGVLVTRDELLAALWPDAHVSDDALQQIVRKMRKALGDDAKEARFLETIPKRGYRFVAEVIVIDEGVDGDAAVAPAEPATTEPATAEPATNEPATNEPAPTEPATTELATTEPATTTETPPPSTVARAAIPPPPPPRRRRVLAVAGAALALGTLGAIVTRRLLHPPASGPRLHRGPCTPVRLTHSPEREQDGAFLDDRVVFVANDPDEGQYDLYLTSRAGAGRIRLTHTPGDEFYPQVAPDRGAILYTRGDASGLAVWEIGPTGGTARLIVEDAAWATYAPDGRALAFVRSTATGTQLVVTDRAGQHPRTIATVDGTAEALAWSPDGRRLAFVDGTRVWTIAITGGAPVPASPHASHLRTAAWAGSALVSDGNYAGRGGLWWLGAATPIALTTNSGGQYHPAVDRGELSYVAETKLTSVWLTDAAGPRRIPTTTAIECLDASSDGRSIGFTDYDPTTGAADTEAVVQDLAGARRDVLGPGRCPRFAPTGDRIAYLRQTDQGLALWVHPGGRFGPPEVQPIAQPAWTADGTALVVATPAGLTRVEAERAIVIAPGTFGRVDVGPDGWIIASHAGAIAVLDPTGALHPMPVAASYDNRPLWTPTGFAVLRDERRHPRLVTYDRAGREVGTEPIEVAPDPSLWGVFEVAPFIGGRVALHTRYESDLFLLRDCLR